ncbi:methyltransferase [Streptomyces sp. NPDC048489]|uniref:methyltransferase n=1 Tax=Streptomyces sp. NPDC048489 TaxID=3154504 RepID=UPI00343FBA25
MMAIITGQWVSQIARTVAEFRVPELLHEEPRSAEEIAESAGADADATFRLMRAAVSVGLAAYDDISKRFSKTALLDRLRGDAPDSLRNLAIAWNSPGHWAPWGLLPSVVRYGHDLTREALDGPIWEYYASNSDEGELFTQGIAELSAPTIRQAVKVISARPGDVIADLGGATGIFVLEMLKEYPETTGIINDLPHVTKAAQSEIEARGMSDRCTTDPTDFFEAVPEADIYLMKFIMHDWDDDACIKLLTRCRRAMKPGGRVVIVDMVIGPVADPGPAALMDINMLTMLPGRERDHSDLDRFFAAAGLKRSATIGLTSPEFVIEAVALES